MPEVGYQEVHLSRAFSRIGNQVKVFTSAASVNLGGSIKKMNYKTGLSLDKKWGYEILRLPSVSFKSKVIPFGLKNSVIDFAPDVLIILGVAKLFPAPLLSAQFPRTIKMISIYGDATEYLERETLSQKIKTFFHELGYATIKKYLYLKAVKYCHKIILNIPETNEVFNHFLKNKNKSVFESKKIMLNLGFDPDEYFFTDEDRMKTRKKLGISEDEVIIITSTRVNKRKNIERVIKLVSQLNSEGKKIRYIIAGFLGDDYEKELKHFIRAQFNPEQFFCFPFLSAEEIRKLYCAADAGIWLKAAISIQEAMGTGLPVILENKSSVNHLIKDNFNGWFFEKEDFNTTVKKVVSVLSSKKTDRKKMSSENAVNFSYDNIARKMIESFEAEKISKKQ